jgi:hypothetical protein
LQVGHVCPFLNGSATMLLQTNSMAFREISD